MARAESGLYMTMNVLVLVHGICAHQYIYNSCSSFHSFALVRVFIIFHFPIDILSRYECTTHSCKIVLMRAILHETLAYAVDISLRLTTKRMAKKRRRRRRDKNTATMQPNEQCVCERGIEIVFISNTCVYVCDCAVSIRRLSIYKINRKLLRIIHNYMV